MQLWWGILHCQAFAGHLDHWQRVKMAQFFCHVCTDKEPEVGRYDLSVLKEEDHSMCTHMYSYTGNKPVWFNLCSGRRGNWLLSCYFVLWVMTPCVSLRLCQHHSAALCCAAAPAQVPRRKQLSLHRFAPRLTGLISEQAKCIRSTFSTQIHPVVFTLSSPIALFYLFHFSGTS